MNSKLLVVEKCHNNHPLTFHEKHPVSSSINVRDEEDDELVCNGCAQLISKTSPVWGCDCGFLLHNFCATNLPSEIENYFMEIQLSTKEPGHCKRYFNSMFFCFLCSRPCNGFGCFFIDYPSSVCIECVLSPKTATHGSHLSSGQQHILFLTNTFFKTPTSGPFACCSRKQCDDDRTLYYSCVACDFRIHVGCALLPKKASHHEFDKHTLELVFTNDEKSFEKIEEDCDCFCEFCEEDIDQGYWFYRCAECGYCKEIVDGFVDDMAFRCDECDFWIHFRCARDCCSIGQMVEHELLLWEDVIVKNPFFNLF